jgi:hypothetical protein
MPPTSKVELYAAIRRDARAGLSGRALERKYNVGRRTVVKALASAWPQPRKKPPPRPSKLDLFKPVIDEILRVDLDAPRKQRHTVKRIFDRLIDEHGMADVSYQVVRTYVAVRKPEIRAEAGHGPAEVFIPQAHRPGMDAEVDFGEVAVRLRGTLVTCVLLTTPAPTTGIRQASGPPSPQPRTGARPVPPSRARRDTSPGPTTPCPLQTFGKHRAPPGRYPRPRTPPRTRARTLSGEGPRT